MERVLRKYRLYSSSSNLRVFLNLENIKSPEEFLSINHVETILSSHNTSFQKLWNFFSLTPLLEAWWKGDKIVSEFLIDTNKHRKIYSSQHLELFIKERLLPLEILPSHVFDFLGFSSSKEIAFYDKMALENIRNVSLCKICGKSLFFSEIVEYIDTNSGICCFCMNRISPEERRKIETPHLFRKRIEETWRTLTEKQREQLIFNILRETRKPSKLEEILNLRLFAKKLSSKEKIFEINEISHHELEEIVKRLDNDYFITWWEKMR